MRKILFSILVLGIILGMSNCDNGDVEKEVNPFLGAWEYNDDGKNGGFLFTESELKEYYFDLPEEKIQRKAHFWENPIWFATYTYDNTTLTINYSENPNHPTFRPDKEWERLIPYDNKNVKKEGLDIRGFGNLVYKTTTPTFD